MEVVDTGEMSQEQYAQHMRLFKIISESEDKAARQYLDDGKKGIEYFYNLPADKFEQLPLHLQDALNKLRKLNESALQANKMLQLNINTIRIDEFAYKYYRWFRGESVPEQVLKNSQFETEEKYKEALFNDWCVLAGRATAPVYVVDMDGAKLYLIPPLHCRDVISVREQTGNFVQKSDGKIELEASSGIINDNIGRIEMLQNDKQKQAAMKNLFDSSISVNGANKESVEQWAQAWRDVVTFFDKAFGLEPLDETNKNVKSNSSGAISHKKDTGYSGALDDAF